MRRFRVSPSLLLALVAVVLSVSGTAVAAKLITGKQIKDGSISAKDLTAGLRAQLAKSGETGPKGETGLKGDPGAKGDTGPVTGSAGGDLSGSYPNPTLRAPTFVPVPEGALTSDCSVTFDELCVVVGSGYWSHDPALVPGYYVEPAGFVQFEGVILAVTAGGLFENVFRLPPGRRPGRTVRLPIRLLNDVGPDIAATLVVEPGGLVRVDGGSGNGQQYDLSGARFHISG